MKVLIRFILLIVIITFQPKAEAFSYRPTPIKSFKIQPSYQYRQINGYYKSNGTYVNPYRRGLSNSIREDNLNYSYKNIFGRKIYPNR